MKRRLHRSEEAAAQQEKFQVDQGCYVAQSIMVLGKTTSGSIRTHWDAKMDSEGVCQLAQCA